MTVHKLSAGIDGGYSYLTRQVPSADQRGSNVGRISGRTAVWMLRAAETDR